MLGPTWFKVKFKLKLSNQVKRKTKRKQTGWKWMGRQIKDDVKFGEYELKLNPNMRRCCDMKTRQSKI